jgi:hypothetical protein
MEEQIFAGLSMPQAAEAMGIAGLSQGRFPHGIARNTVQTVRKITTYVNSYGYAE